MGTLLRDAYAKQGWEVVVLGRSPSRTLPNAKLVHWDGCTLDDWADVLEGATAVVNLAGRPINTRFTAKNKSAIMDSRVFSTAVIGEAIGRCQTPPRVWINAGGISVFAPSAVQRTEEDLPDGTGFLAAVSQHWEAAFADAAAPATRKILLRISPVLLAHGGTLAPLVRLAKLGLGGAVGSGNQYMSWIHQDDFVKLVQWLVGHEGMAGTIHACSPHPLTNADFMRALRKRIGAPFGIPAPAWAVRLGAPLIGVEPQLALDGYRVTSHVLKEAGFPFDFPELGAALRNLML